MKIIHSHPRPSRRGRPRAAGLWVATATGCIDSPANRPSRRRRPRGWGCRAEGEGAEAKGGVRNTRLPGRADADLRALREPSLRCVRCRTGARRARFVGHSAAGLGSGRRRRPARLPWPAVPLSDAIHTMRGEPLPETSVLTAFQRCELQDGILGLMWPDKCGAATKRRQIVGKGRIYGAAYWLDFLGAPSQTHNSAVGLTVRRRPGLERLPQQNSFSSAYRCGVPVAMTRGTNPMNRNSVRKERGR